MTSYGCLIIGDEILAGKVQESNLIYAIHALAVRGYKLAEVRMVADNLERIANGLGALKAEYNFVLSFGGVGPTHDDITMKAYAHCFNKALVKNELMYEWLTRKPRSDESEIAAVDYMSTLPEDIELIQPDNNWPILKLENCFALPGLPSIFKKTIDTLAALLPQEAGEHYASLFVKERESSLALWLSQYAQQHDELKLGSYPIERGMQYDELLDVHKYCTRISITTQTEIECNLGLQALTQEFAARGTLINMPEQMGR